MKWMKKAEKIDFSKLNNKNNNLNFTEDSRELESAVEGILFASGEPVHIERFCTALGIERGQAEQILRRLRDYYAFERRGMRLLRMEDKWQLCSAPDYADVIRKAFEIRKPAKLSQPALEALTIIAYYQPTTRAYVDKLRGVDSAYTVKLLEERGLIESCGRLAVPGRPVLYRTTEQFLRSFHIDSLADLPPLPEGEFRRNFETLLDDVQEQFLSAKADGVELEIPGDMNADMRESIKNILSMAELMYKGGGAPCVERMLKRFFLRGVLK